MILAYLYKKKIDYELSWSFQGKTFVASTLIYKYLSVGHADSNGVFLQFLALGFDSVLLNVNWKFSGLQIFFIAIMEIVSRSQGPHRAVHYILNLINYTQSHKNVRTPGVIISCIIVQINNINYYTSHNKESILLVKK